MATLDDAIREHLELKRKHGADESELQELEDSAFGPPERPGEDAESGAATTVMAADAPAAEVVQQPEPPEAPVESPEVTEPPAAIAEEELTGTEQARQEYPQLDDTAAHEPVAPPPVQSTEEQDALEISLFESEGDDEEDFDIGEIDLDLGAGEAAPEPEAQTAPEADLEELLEDTAREHVLIEPEDSPDPTPMVDPDASEDEAGEASGTLVDPDPTDEGHDVLEETPEFLRDAPESDEMWFEQDKPKDFDFDED